MPEIIGDIIIPKVLILPDIHMSGAMLMSGANLFLSGSKLHFMEGSRTEIITSA